MLMVGELLMGVVMVMDVGLSVSTGAMAVVTGDSPSPRVSARLSYIH